MLYGYLVWILDFKYIIIIIIIIMSDHTCVLHDVIQFEPMSVYLLALEH